MEVVDREHIAMIVISTDGISGWHPLVFGSIAEKLVRNPIQLVRQGAKRKKTSCDLTPVEIRVLADGLAIRERGHPTRSDLPSWHDHRGTQS